MKITKTAAELTAKQMAEQAMDEKINQKEVQIIDFIRSKVQEQTPVEIMTMFSDERFTKFFNQRRCFRISNNGKVDHYEDYALDKPFPVQDSGYYVDLKGSDYDRFVELRKELNNLESSKKRLISRIYDAVLSMGTVKRLQNDFPEAYNAMPDQFKTERVTTSLAVPIADIITELNFYRD